LPQQVVTGIICQLFRKGLIVTQKMPKPVPYAVSVIFSKFYGFLKFGGVFIVTAITADTISVLYWNC
jgi:hypothetical protein